MDVPVTIECGIHKHTPYSFICIHLLKGKSRKWVPVELIEGDFREVDWDYLCPKCYTLIDSDEDVQETVVAVCTSCIRNIQERDGYIPAIKLDECDCEEDDEK